MIHKTPEQLGSEIQELNKKLKKFEKEARILSIQISDLRRKKYRLITKSVFEYIKPGDIITFEKDYNHLQKGDVIKIVRKNKKTITIEYVNVKSYYLAHKKKELLSHHEACVSIYTSTAVGKCIARNNKLKIILN